MSSDGNGGGGKGGLLPIDQPGDVREEERLDAERLATFLAKAFPEAAGPVTQRQFRSGHSNLTYLVTFGGREAVLRRAPRGTSIKTAHDMSREYGILTALSPIYPKVPKPLAYCPDETVIGAPFYLMERVPGIILRGGTAPPGLALTPERMRSLSTALVDDLAALHALDVSSGPLAALGKPQGYVERQVRGWTDRYVRAKTDEIPAVEETAVWIAGHMPEESGAALIHNDYKYDNLVLDPADLTRIVAVLDWEMATVGDPLMDLGTTLGYWVDPDDPAEVKTLPFGPTLLSGNLSRLEIVERYGTITGRDPGSLLFHYVFALFKIAVIAQQIYRRWTEGHTRDPRFGALIHGVRILGNQAKRAVVRGRIYDLG
jgi:aminoglycoside phosphotransferase (APT) family kinase protein